MMLREKGRVNQILVTEEDSLTVVEEKIYSTFKHFQGSSTLTFLSSTVSNDLFPVDKMVLLY